MVSIAGAAARDDVYELTELSLANRGNPGRLARIARALEESIPRLDPVRFRSELEHVLAGPEVPELTAAKRMARAALERKTTDRPSDLGTEQAGPATWGLLGWVDRHLWRPGGRPRSRR